MLKVTRNVKKILVKVNLCLFVDDLAKKNIFGSCSVSTFPIDHGNNTGVSDNTKDGCIPSL